MTDYSLYQTMKADCSADWAAYVEHDFVRGLGDGTLSRASFEYYLRQDYLFLIHFARAHALAAFQADTLADLRQSAKTVGACARPRARATVSSWTMIRTNCQTVIRSSVDAPPPSVLGLFIGVFPRAGGPERARSRRSSNP